MGYSGWENFSPGEKKKNPDKQWQGRVNKQNGELLERYILESCDYYREMKVADIDKTPEPFRVLSGLHRLACGVIGFEGVFTKKAQPDFKGTLAGGRSVVFEAKCSTTGRILQSEVTETQAESMKSHSALGADVFVIVSLDLATFYRVPWGVWVTMKERFGHKYMDRENLAPYEIKFKNGVLNFL